MQKKSFNDFLYLASVVLSALISLENSRHSKANGRYFTNSLLFVTYVYTYVHTWAWVLLLLSRCVVIILHVIYLSVCGAYLRFICSLRRSFVLANSADAHAHTARGWICHYDADFWVTFTLIMADSLCCWHALCVNRRFLWSKDRFGWCCLMVMMLPSVFLKVHKDGMEWQSVAGEVGGYKQ